MALQGVGAFGYEEEPECTAAVGRVLGVGHGGVRDFFV